MTSQITTQRLSYRRLAAGINAGHLHVVSTATFYPGPGNATGIGRGYFDARNGRIYQTTGSAFVTLLVPVELTEHPTQQGCSQYRLDSEKHGAYRHAFRHGIESALELDGWLTYAPDLSPEADEPMTA